MIRIYLYNSLLRHLHPATILLPNNEAIFRRISYLCQVTHTTQNPEGENISAEKY